MLATIAVCAWGRVWFARGLVGMSAKHWLLKIFVPVAGVAMAGLAVGALPRLWMGPSLGRIVLTTAMCEPVFLGMAWAVGLDAEEKGFVLDKVRGGLSRLKGGAE